MCLGDTFVTVRGVVLLRLAAAGEFDGTTGREVELEVHLQSPRELHHGCESEVHVASQDLGDVCRGRADAPSKLGEFALDELVHQMNLFIRRSTLVKVPIDH